MKHIMFERSSGVCGCMPTEHIIT